MVDLLIQAIRIKEGDKFRILYRDDTYSVFEDIHGELHMERVQ